MPIDSEPALLATTHGTILYFDRRSRSLRHADAVFAVDNLRFIDQSKSIEVIGGHPVAGAASAFNFPSVDSWTVKQHADGDVSIKCDGHFASAEPRGGVTFDRKRVLDWERFKLISMSDYRARRAWMRERVETVPLFPRRRSITRTIHQTFPTHTLPDGIADAVRQLRDMNPDYDYILWSDKDVLDFIYDTYGYGILSAYLRINRLYGAGRADIFRYLCVYKFGGVYLDIKSGTTRPLSSIIRDDDEYLLSHWDNSAGTSTAGFGRWPEVSQVPGGEYEQWHIIAAQGHPFLERVIDRVLCNIEMYDPGRDGVGKRGVIKVTGPIAYTLAIWDIVADHPHRIIRSQSEGLVYKTVDDHKRLFEVHYSQVDRPVVD